MKLQYKRHLDTMYAYDDNYNFLGSWPCHHAFFQGTGSNGLPHETLPDGYYPHCWADLPNTTLKDGRKVVIQKENPRSYGTFYINTGDDRGRDIHGGGDGYGITDPFAKRQGWLGTYGCLRMQNEDGEKIAKMMIDAGNDIGLVVEE